MPHISRLSSPGLGHKIRSRNTQLPTPNLFQPRLRCKPPDLKSLIGLQAAGREARMNKPHTRPGAVFYAFLNARPLGMNDKPWQAAPEASENNDTGTNHTVATATQHRHIRPRSIARLWWRYGLATPMWHRVPEVSSGPKFRRFLDLEVRACTRARNMTNQMSLRPSMTGE